MAVRGDKAKKSNLVHVNCAHYFENKNMMRIYGEISIKFALSTTFQDQNDEN